jgi:hypothetical protein
LNDAGIANVTEQTLLKVIDSGNGSARDILDSVVSIVLKAKREQKVVAHHTDSICLEIGEKI